MTRVLAVTNAYPTPRAPGIGPYIEQQVSGLRQIGLEVEVLFVERQQKGMSAYMGLGSQLRVLVRKYKPDLVHSMYGGVMANVVTRTVRDRPVVVSFCGSDLLGEVLSGYLELGKPLVGCYRTLVSMYGVRSSYRAARKASGIVVKSKNLQDALPPDVDRNKVRIVPNGIDLERFKPIEKKEARRTLGWPEDSGVVLFVTAGGDPRKRLGLAREAVAKATTNGDVVEFRTMQGVPHEQVPVWLSASDVLLLTSFHEGGVNIVKEAMACNLPVVSVDVGDVRERLCGVRQCAVVDATPDALGQALRSVLLCRERSNGREYLQDLTLVAVAERIKQVYARALENGRL